MRQPDRRSGEQNNNVCSLRLRAVTISQRAEHSVRKQKYPHLMNESSKAEADGASSSSSSSSSNLMPPLTFLVDQAFCATETFQYSSTHKWRLPKHQFQICRNESSRSAILRNPLNSSVYGRACTTPNRGKYPIFLGSKVLCRFLRNDQSRTYYVAGCGNTLPVCYYLPVAHLLRGSMWKHASCVLLSTSRASPQQGKHKLLLFSLQVIAHQPVNDTSLGVRK